MIYLKTYEENRNEPQVGDYAIIGTRANDKDLIDFLKNNIAKIIYIDDTSVTSVYEYIPENILKNNNFTNSIRVCDCALIEHFAKNKEDLEIKISTNKYNI